MNPILAAIEEHERLATGFGTLQEDRSEALDQYHGRPYGDEQEGHSQVVMRDVSDTVEWIKPSLMKVFASGDEVVSFSPEGPEDQQQSEQETDYVNHVLMQRNNGFLILHDWFHDALVQKTGYVIVGYETETRRQREPYRNLTDDEFALLANNPEVEIVEHAQRQELMPDGSVLTYHDCVLVSAREYGCVKVKNIPPERVLVAADWPHLDLQGCPFVEVIDWQTISELRSQGYDVDDNINDNSQYSEDEWEEQRREVSFDGQLDRYAYEADPAMRRVRVRRVWIRHDSDGDGIAELRRVVVVGATILEDEEDDLVPVAAITGMRTPHEHYGMSIADVVKDLQRIRTVLVRGFLDSMYLANNGRHAIDESRVNLDDMLVSRPGGIVRVQGDPGSAIVPLQHQHQGPAILQAIEYIDSVRENRTGVTSYNQGLDANSLNKTAHGINQIMTAAQQRIDLIARIMAETGVKALMLIVHAMSLKHGRQQELVKIRNQWVPVDPRTWKTRRDMIVSVGLGTGNKDQQLQHLMMILQQQQMGMPVGLATPVHVYNTLKKISQNAGFKNADEFWADPQRFQPPPAPPSPEMIKAQAEQQKLQFQAQQDQMKFQAQQAMEAQRLQMQAELDRNREEMQARQKALEAQQQAELERIRVESQERMKAAELELRKYEADLQASVAIQSAQTSAQTTLESAQLSKQPDSRVDELMQALQALQQQAAQEAERKKLPKKFIRNPQTGVIEAWEQGGEVTKVIRDPDGRAIGVQ